MTVATKSIWLVFVLGATACAPMQSTVPPPYRYEAVTYDEPGMQMAAADYCAAQPVSAEPEFPFTTDGCSMAPDGTWGECCLAHDVKYWCGGSREQRLSADRELKACLQNHEKPALAQPVFLRNPCGRMAARAVRLEMGLRRPLARTAMSSGLL